MSKTPHRRTERGERTRQKIMETATALICKRGYSATSVDLICREAKVVKTALYWHFGSKAGLLSAIFDDIKTHWVDVVANEIAGKGDGPSRLDSMMAAFRDIVVNRPHLLRIVDVIICESGSIDPDALESVRRLHKNTMATIMGGFEHAMGAPLPRAEQLSHTITGLLRGIHRHYILYGDELDLDAYFDDFKRTIVACVAARVQEMR